MQETFIKLIDNLTDSDSLIILALTAILLYISYAWGVQARDVVNVGIGGLVGYLGSQVKAGGIK
jgi:hypothetical protein